MLVCKSHNIRKCGICTKLGALFYFPVPEADSKLPSTCRHGNKNCDLCHEVSETLDKECSKCHIVLIYLAEEQLGICIYCQAEESGGIVTELQINVLQHFARQRVDDLAAVDWLITKGWSYV